MEIAAKHGKTTAQVMLRWQLQRGIVSLSKSATLERIRQNFDIFNFELTEADMEEIATINKDATVFAEHNEASTVELLAGFIGKTFWEKVEIYKNSSTKQKKLASELFLELVFL